MLIPASRETMPYEGSLVFAHPGLARAGTNLSYCNGEIVPGSSNITLYIVWPWKRAPLVAQTLQHVSGLQVESENEVGEPREQDKATAMRRPSQQLRETLFNW